MTNNELIAKWLYEGTAISGASGIPYDSNIEFWHGEDGILAEIKRRWIELDFIFELQVALHVVPKEGLTHGDIALLYWPLLCATPAQLAAALVKVIGEGE